MPDRRTTHAGSRWSIARHGAAAVAATAGLAAAASAEAAIIYTNPPDVAVDSANPLAPLNLDGNGTTDFEIEFVVGELVVSPNSTPIPFTAIALDGAIGNSVVAEHKPIPATPFPFVTPLPSGDTIPGGHPFIPEALFRLDLASESSLSFWEDDQVAFAGLKFLIGSDTHFGWARFQVGGSANGPFATLFDFAYCDQPTTSIAAGQTSGACGAPVGVPEPSSLLLLATGAVAVEALRRWRRSKDAAA